MFHGGESGELEVDEIDEELAIYEGFDADEYVAVEAQECTGAERVLFALVEGGLHLSLDDTEEDILPLVVVWGDLLPLGEVYVYDRELVVTEDVSEFGDFLSKHRYYGD